MATGKISMVWASANTGEFVRQVSSFRNWISSAPGSKFLPEANRYHLYLSLACPWAHRTLVYRALKGLEDVISISVVDTLLGEDGWKFVTDQETPGCIPDVVNHATYVRELYFKAEPNYNARFTVPILWDRQHETIVNNESSEIIRMLNSEFNQLAKNPILDLYPEPLRARIDELNAWIYDDINNGVYKAGFATKQDVYEKHCRILFEGLSKVEQILSQQRFLVENQLTEADVRLFTTLVRFDPVYHGHFKCNMKTLEHGFPHILKWMRRVYQYDGGKVAQTVNMTHIKDHYYKSHIKINPNQIVPLGMGPDLTIPVDN